MKNSGFPTTRMSPCLRVFIESLLLDESGGALFVEEVFVSDEGLAMSAGLGSTAPLASDKSYH